MTEIKENKMLKLYFSAFLSVFLFTPFAGCSTVNRSPGPSIVDAGPSEVEVKKELFIKEEGSPEHLAAQHFSLGQSYSLDGNTEKAIEEYRLALVYDAGSAVIHTRLATEYVKRGLLSFAIEECKTAIKLDATYTDARLLLAGLYGATKLLPEAIKEYDGILKYNAKNTDVLKEVYTFKGSLLLEEGQAKPALEVLNKLVKLDPESHLGYYYIGRAHQILEDRPQAVKAFKKALEIKPSFTQGTLALGLYHEEKKDIREAIKVYDAGFSEVRDSQIAARLVQIYIDKEDYKKALKYLLVLDRLEEDNLNVKAKVGLVYVELKEYKNAAKSFEEILKRNPDADKIRFYLASVYEELKQYESAIETLQKISKESSSYGDACIRIAFFSKMKGNTKEALQWVDRALSSNPEVAQYHTFRASLVDEVEGPDKAISYLESLKEKFSKDEKQTYYLGTLYDKKKDYNKAIAVMKTILEINPDSVNALNYIGYTLAVKGESLDSAESMIRRALQMKPEDAYIRDSLGYLLMKKGLIKEAITELEKAFRAKSSEGVIAEHLADAYLELNLRSKALQKYMEALKLYTDPVEKGKVDQKIDELKGGASTESAYSTNQHPVKKQARERHPAAGQ